MSDTNITSRIEGYVKGAPVVVFMKGTPVFPQCGFSNLVTQVFEHLGVKYSSHNVLEDDDLRQGIKEYSDWPTIPQVYLNGEFLGGCDIIKEMFETGELQTLFKEKGIIAN